VFWYVVPFTREEETFCHVWPAPTDGVAAVVCVVASLNVIVVPLTVIAMITPYGYAVKPFSFCLQKTWLQTPYRPPKLQSHAIR
jgi:hypothetical protein